MDSNALTHVAAIVVGVLVTLALVGTFSSSKSSSTSADDSRSSTDRNTNAKTTDGGKKKKKKKKGGKNASDDSTAAADAKMEALVKEEENKENANNNNKGSANGSNNNNNNDSGGGKKKKKKKNKGGNNANGSATSNGKAQATEAPKATPTPAAAPAPKAASTTSDGWQTVPPVEEEWESVGKNSKKGKKKVKTATVTAASKAPTAAAAGAPAAAPAAASATDSVTVDAKKIGIIIGPKGATMMAIQEATGCKLDINAPGGKGDGPNNNNNNKAAARVSAMAKAGVIITGNDKESIAKAKKAVLELASKGYATLLQADPNFGEFGTEVHPRMLSEIVGPGGKTIQALQTSLNVKITIPPTDWKPNNRQTNIHNREVVKPVLVGIAGSKENAKTAKEVIKSLAKYHHHEVTHPGMIHEEVHVPREFFHCVIGPRGSEIKHIRGNYKVDMYMPNDDSATDNVLVVGRQANVEKAIAYIQLLMDRDAEKNDQKYTDEYY